MKFFLLALCLLSTLAFAHNEPLHGAQQVMVSGAASVTNAAKAAQKIDWPVLLKASLTTHLHNKVVHFPIALGLVGILFFIFSMKFEGLRGASRWLLFLGALGAVVAAITGRAQEKYIEGEAAKQVLEIHESLGVGVAISLWVVWLLSFAQSSYKWLWLLLILLAAAILFEGNLGGVLAHRQL